MTVFQDLRFSCRVLRKRFLLTATAIVSLGLGLGGNTAIFSLISAAILRPLPVPRPDRLAEVFTSSRAGEAFSVSSVADYEDLRARAASFSNLAAYTTVDLRLGGDSHSQTVVGALVSSNYFETLDVDPLLGRSFSFEEGRWKGNADNRVAVVAHGLWQRSLGGDRNAVGRMLEVNGIHLTVIGVAPPGFRGTKLDSSPVLWIPLTMISEFAPQQLAGEDVLVNRGARWLNLVGHLEPGVGIDQVRAELDLIGRQLESAYPETNEGRQITTIPAVSAAISPGSRDAAVRYVWMLLAAVGFALLMACANVANLLLVRALGRRREIAVRLAMGAPRAHLVRQLLTESVVLSSLGGAAGLLVAAASMRLMGSFQLPGGVSIERLQLSLDGRALGFTLLLSLATGVIFGLVPAFQASRPDLVPALKGLTGDHRGGRLPIHTLFLVVQVALCFMLLIGAVLFAWSLWNALSIDLGFADDELVVAAVNLGLQDYTGERAAEFYREADERLMARPGVRAVSLVSRLPIVRSGTGYIFNIAVESYQPQAGEDMSVHLLFIGPDYFSTVGTPLLQGREFNDRDRAGTPKVLIVNESLARRFWPEGKGVGRRIQPSSDEPFMEIAGVVADSRLSLHRNNQSILYMPISQYIDFAGLSLVHFMVRVDRAPAEMLATVRDVISEIDSEVPLEALAPFSAEMNQVLRPQRTGAALLSLFSVLALVLAVIGIYGLVTYLVQQKTREIGIRLTLGARPSRMFKLILWWGLAPTGIGVVVGLISASAMTHLISAFFFGVTARDPMTFSVVSSILIMVALGASLGPARKAARIDPVVVLRQD